MNDRPIDRWSRLRSSEEGDGVLEVPSLSSGVETGYGPVRFATGSNGEPRLLVPCGTGSSLATARPTANLSLALTRLNLAGRATTFIDLTCMDRGLDPVFAEIANEVLHRIATGASPVPAVVGTISDFRELLRECSDPDVEDIKIFGLLGELFVMRELVRLSPAAIDAWTGPYEQRHDFRRRQHALEVKTSTRADATRVTINGCEQLSEPADGTLGLVHLKLERAEQGHLHVAQLAADILGLGASKDVLERGLSAMGCGDHRSSAWNRIRCELEGMSAYRVSEGFPRLTKDAFPGGAVPEGVSWVSYVLDLRFAGEFLMSAEDFEIACRRIAE